MQIRQHFKPVWTLWKCTLSKLKHESTKVKIWWNLRVSFIAKLKNKWLKKTNVKVPFDSNMESDMKNNWFMWEIEK